MADRVTFTPRSAQRIADAVLKVEAGDRNNRGIMFNMPPGQEQQKVVRMCTFTAAWAIGSQQTVTFRNNTTSPNTVTAYNLFWPITENPQEATDCAIGKDGTAWYLVAVPLATATVVVGISTAAVTCITDVSISATLDTNSCAITIGKTISTENIASLDTVMITEVLVLGF